MGNARKRLELTQKEIATRLGCKQAVISQIENGTIRASKFVLAITRMLAIAPPMHFRIAEQNEWSRLGHLLQSGDPGAFALQLASLRQAVARIEKQEQEKRELREALAYATKKRSKPDVSSVIATRSPLPDAESPAPSRPKKKTG